MNQIQKTTVLPGEAGALRVEITIADTSDIVDAREAVTLIAVVGVTRLDRGGCGAVGGERRHLRRNTLQARRAEPN
jgi:hypothetical protein